MHMGASVAAYRLGLLALLGALAALGADSAPAAPLLAFGFLILGMICLTGAEMPRLPSGVIWAGAGVLFVLLVGQSIVVLSGQGQEGGAVAQEGGVLMAGIACFILGRVAALETKAADRAMAWFMAALVVVAVLSFIDFVAAPEQVFGRAKPFHQDRLTGPFLSANTAATFFAVSTVLAFVHLLRAARGAEGSVVRALERVGRRALLPLILFVFALTALLLTGSRAGLLVMIGSLGGLFLWDAMAARKGAGPSASKSLALGMSAFFILLIVLWWASGGIAQDRLVGLQTDDAGRGVLWQASWNAFLASPLWGHGLGRFTEAIAPYITEESAPILILQGAAHNLPLQWLLQTGVIGTLAAVAFLWALSRHLLAGLSKRRRQRTLIRTVIICGGLALVHGLVDYGVEIPAVFWTLCLLLGLGSGIADGRTATTNKRLS